MFETLGNYFFNLNRYDEALDYYNKAIEVYNVIKSDFNDSYFFTKEQKIFNLTILLNTAIIYQDLRKTSQGLIRSNLVISKAESFENSANEVKQIIGIALNNIGNLYYDQKNYKSANEYFIRAMDVFKEMLNNENENENELVLQNTYYYATAWFNSGLTIKLHSNNKIGTEKINDCKLYIDNYKGQKNDLINSLIQRINNIN